TSASTPRGKGKKTALEGGDDAASSTGKGGKATRKKKPVDVEEEDPMKPKPKPKPAEAEAEEEDPMPRGRAKKRADSGDASQEEEVEEESPKPKLAARTHSDIFSRTSMEIATYGDTDHVFVFSPTVALSVERPTEGWSFSGRYLVDMVSAASVDIVSTATQHWTETRHAGSLNGQYKPHDFGIAASASISREPDYLSLSGGAAILYDFNGKNDTMTLGYGYGRDSVGRHFTNYDIFSGVLKHNAFTAGLTFVINRTTVGSLSLDGVFESGDESKPYRYVPMFSSTVSAAMHPGASIDVVNQLRLPERPAEQLPTERKRYAATLRLAHRYDSSTLRFEERLYDDDWGIKASTTDLRYMIDLSRRVTFWPHFRAHIQTGASFWQLAYVSNRTAGNIATQGDWSVPAIRTGDRELSQLWTGTTGLGIQWAIGGTEHPSSWVLSMNGDLMYTSYADALYILYRTGGFFSFGLEAEL
ncbi:MAG: DUF3570 domain-containing protein, partial [Polyangiales bacterium]